MVDEMEQENETPADAATGARQKAAPMGETKPEGAGGEMAKPRTAEQLQGSTNFLPFSDKGTYLEELRKGVVDAAAVSTGLWLSYLFVFFYLAIAGAGVTHRDLLFQNPVKLPFLNVDLPLLAFFILGPLLFLVVHAYVLLHFVLLASKVSTFDVELKSQVTESEARTPLRRLLPSNIFVQVLAGPKEVRHGAVGLMLQLIAWISLVVCPLALLAFFQFQFLPYHQIAITWWQRVATVLDLWVLWQLWPSILSGKSSRLRWRDFGNKRLQLRLIPLAVATPVVLWLVFAIAVIPGEWLDGKLPTAGMDKVLVAGEVDYVARKPSSFWSNRLVLPGVDVIDRAKFDNDAKVQAASETLSLRGRRLENAVLIGAQMPKVDFTAARLQGAAFDGADLRGAKFVCGERAPGVEKSCTHLQGARLIGAQLQEANFEGALLQNAVLDSARMHGANFRSAFLQYASFEGGQLQGATLDRAHLQGARFIRAHLQAASLINAGLQAATFQESELQGAVLNYAHLEGASLLGAQLQGASLSDTHLMGARINYPELRVPRKANLQGASLDHSQLQGAILNGVDLQGASLKEMFAWRADLRNANAAGARVVDPKLRPKYHGLKCREQECDWSIESVAALKEMIEREVPPGPPTPAGSMRDVVWRSMEETLLPESKVDENEIAEAWTKLQETSLSPNLYEDNLPQNAAWRKTGCSPQGAPYVIRGLMRNFNERFSSNSTYPAALAQAFLDEAQCPGSRGLSTQEKDKLREIIRTRTQKTDADIPTLPP